jgi:hypothetical protein
LYVAYILRDKITYLQGFEGLNIFEKGPINLIYDFLLGNNPIAPQLWYLVTLLIITTICFIILYIKKILLIKAFSFYLQ